jgi:hypothetical protein
MFIFVLLKKVGLLHRGIGAGAAVGASKFFPGAGAASTGCGSATLILAKLLSENVMTWVILLKCVPQMLTFPQVFKFMRNRLSVDNIII